MQLRQLKKLCAVFLLLLFSLEVAGAAPIVSREHCGDGIDNKQQYIGQEGNCPMGWMSAKTLGGCDKKCPRPDADWDGFPEVGACNYPAQKCDCAPDDKFIYPGSGLTTLWCLDGSGNPSGKVHQCNDDGTWTPCADFACPDGKQCYFFSPTGSNTTGNGTIGNPWRDLGKVSYWNSTAPYTLHTPVANDIYFLRGGVYNFDNALGYGSRTFACRNNFAGTPSSKIVIQSFPGETVEIQSQATSSNRGAALYLEGCDNWTVAGSDKGMKFSGGYGYPILANNGAGGSDDLTLQNLILTAAGNGDDNHSCIEFGSISNPIVQSVIAYDCYKNASAENPNPGNNSIITAFRTDNFKLLYSTLFYSSWDPSGSLGSVFGSCFKTKHTEADSSFYAEGDVLMNCSHGAWLVNNDWSINKWLVDTAARLIDSVDHGGDSFFDAADHVVELQRGIAYDAGGMEYNPSLGYYTDLHEPRPADLCSGNGGIATFKVADNYIKSNITSYNGENREFRQWVYGPDFFLSPVLKTPLTFQNNTWYNPFVPVTFGIHESNNGDTSCGGRGNLGQSYSVSEWQAAGRDTAASGSKFEDCDLDEFERCTKAGHQSHGRILLSDEYLPVSGGQGFQARKFGRARR